MEPKHKQSVWNTYDKVVVITTKHIGVFLDLSIPFTFGLITYFIPKIEVMRIGYGSN